MNTKLFRHAAAAVLGIALSGAGAASAIELITNGGFEDGFNGWSIDNVVGSDGSFQLQTGTTSPVNAEPVPAPPGGQFAAMTDAQGPGAHVLAQLIQIPVAVTSATLSFDLFIGNRADDFYLPGTDVVSSLTFDTPELNQQARVDFLGIDGGIYDVTSLIAELFQTQPGDALVSGYTHFEIDVTSILAGKSGTDIFLRFAEVDNVDMFQFGVDNVSLVVNENTVPEPGTPALLLAAGVMAAGRLRRRQPRRQD